MSESFKIELISGLTSQVAKLPEVEAPCMVAARQIMQVAQSRAPVQDGGYRDGIVAEKSTSGQGWIVRATNPKSAWVEFGVPSRNIPARWILRRAAESLGYSFKKRG